MANGEAVSREQQNWQHDLEIRDETIILAHCIIRHFALINEAVLGLWKSVGKEDLEEVHIERIRLTNGLQSSLIFFCQDLD